MASSTALLSSLGSEFATKRAPEVLIQENLKDLKRRAIDLATYKRLQRVLILRIASEGVSADQIIKLLSGDKEKCLSELIANVQADEALQKTPTHQLIMRLEDEVIEGEAKQRIQILSAQMALINAKLDQIEVSTKKMLLEDARIAQEKSNKERRFIVDQGGKLDSVIDDIRKISHKANQAYSAPLNSDDFEKEFKDRLKAHHIAIADKLDLYCQLGGNIHDARLAGSYDIDLSSTESGRPSAVVSRIEEDSKGHEVVAKKVGIGSRVEGVVPIGSYLRYQSAGNFFPSLVSEVKANKPEVKANKTERLHNELLYRSLPGK